MHILEDLFPWNRFYHTRICLVHIKRGLDKQIKFISNETNLFRQVWMFNFMRKLLTYFLLILKVHKLIVRLNYHNTNTVVTWSLLKFNVCLLNKKNTIGWKVIQPWLSIFYKIFSSKGRKRSEHVDVQLILKRKQQIVLFSNSLH